MSHCTDKIVEEPFCASKVFWYRKFSSQGGGTFQGFVKFFLSHRTEKLLQGTILCYRIFLVGEHILWVKKRGGGYHEFPRKSFCLPVQIYFIGEQFGVSEKNPLPKKCLIRRGVHHGFVEIFCLTGPKRKSLQRKPSVFQKKSGIEKNDG